MARTPVHEATLPSDTSADVEDLRIGLYREMPAVRKLELVDDAIKTNRQLLWIGLRLRHPAESDERLERRLLELVLGEDLVTRAYGPLNGAE